MIFQSKKANTILVLSSILWSFLAYRNLGFLCLFIFIAAFIFSRNRNAKIIAWFAFFISTLIPLDFTFIDLDGPPKIVPYVMGFPTEEAFAAAERGELVLGSCMVNGLEPKKVVVW